MAKLICHNLTHLAILFIIGMYRHQYSDTSSSFIPTLPFGVQIIL